MISRSTSLQILRIFSIKPALKASSLHCSSALGIGRRISFERPESCGKLWSLTAYRAHGKSTVVWASSMTADVDIHCQASNTIPEALDRSQFDREYTVRALRLPKQCCSKYMKLLRGVVLARPKVKAVVTDKELPDKRILLLGETVTGLEDAVISDAIRAALRADGCEEVEHKMKEDYTLLSTEAVLKRLLPEGCEVPGSFETIGHIAHLNLRDELLPYKHLIGQVIIDKNNSIRTVVNKVGILENEYRVLPLEVIAGKPELEAVVKQNTARFKLDFGEVYWNSRLEEEHTRLTRGFKPGEVVADVMAGVGPFAIPAAQLGCQVHANDLNPRSFHYLQENIKLNKVVGKVHASQLDGREFIRVMSGGLMTHQPSEPSGVGQEEPVLRGDSSQNGAAAAAAPGGASDLPQGGTVYHHAIMNLPATAVEFLDAFRGAFCRELWKGKPLPTVHVYTFARTAETDTDIRRRMEAHLGGSLEEVDVKIRLVRDVAPNKRMMCASFRVPEAVAFSPTESTRGLLGKKGSVQNSELSRADKKPKLF